MIIVYIYMLLYESRVSTVNTKVDVRQRYIGSYGVVTLSLINNYSPKAKWLSVNIHLDFVSVNIHR